MTIEDKTKNLEKRGFAVERRRNKSVILKKNDYTLGYKSMYQAHKDQFGY